MFVLCVVNVLKYVASITRWLATSVRRLKDGFSQTESCGVPTQAESPNYQEGGGSMAEQSEHQLSPQEQDLLAYFHRILLDVKTPADIKWKEHK